MKFQFKIQDYQTNAVNSVVRLFNGQPNKGLAEYIVDKGKIFIKVGDRQVEQKELNMDDVTGFRNADIALSDDTLLDNLHCIQTEGNIKQSNELINELGRCSLDIEMETGTGKTYVYIKTMFELNKLYGWTKFIVVVPSIAIREGVKKAFDITVEHFMEHYGKKARYFIYNSSNLDQIDTFSSSNDIQVMIINTQAFNTSLKEGGKSKDARIIYSKRDEFRSRRPIDVISANRPIIIQDEPQKMGGVATQTALKRFKPLFTLNYSATHKEVHNPVYVLDALDAYNKQLVKQIQVVGFELRHLKGTDKYVYLDGIIVSPNRAPQARITFEVSTARGNIKRSTKLLSVGDDLYYLSSELNEYKGFKISDILPLSNKVEFANGESLTINEAIGDVSADQKARIQIRQTIEAHFKKEISLFKQGIKTLSLFFLDEVANYRQYDAEGNQVLGKYGKMFEEEYNDVMNEDMSLFEPDYVKYLQGIDASDTHAGYFSIDKKGHAVNSSVKRGTDQSDDISAYDLILKNKERLLSFEEPVRFIFSHSALREGWDNPNVFQICSLRQSNSAVQKRQEVGRGLRLCVNKDGVRMDKDVLGDNVQDINKLTVIASEGYASFVSDLQKKIREDLYDRPTKADVDFLVGKIVIADGKEHTITKEEAQEVWFNLRMNNYITAKGEVTDTFRVAIKDGSIKPLPEGLAPLTAGVHTLVQSIYDGTALDKMIENGGKSEVAENKLNENFNRKEFQKLWKRINHKYAYKVSFDCEELIEKSVIAIDSELDVSKLTYVVTSGIQQKQLTTDDFKGGEIFKKEESTTKVLRTGAVTHVKYDLIGKVARETVLTRKTVATILSKIRPSKFSMYQANPEEFLSKVTRLILEQKATVIVEHIAYNQLDGRYQSDIFTEEKHTDYSKAFEAKKSIQPFVFTDSENENKFISELEVATEVVVYAKLPKGFHIPTPVGNYSPDWAISFKKGSVKHVFFVAETKGSLSSMDLRPIEKDKIKCAKKLFKELCCHEVTYDVVESYSDLKEKAVIY